MKSEYAKDGELAILKKKNGKLEAENKSLLQRIKSFKENELNKEKKENKRQRIFSSLKNIAPTPEKPRNNIEMVDKILEKNKDFELFKQYSKNSALFDKYAHFFLKKYPVQIFFMLNEHDVKKFKNKELNQFIKKNCAKKTGFDWKNWYEEL